MIRLDSNENPFGPSPRSIEAVRRCLTESHRYPDNNCSELRSRLGDLHQFPVEQILIGSGSTAVISMLCHTLLRPGLNAVTGERSFVVYGMAVRATGAQLVEAPMRGNEIDLAAILQRINPNTRLALLANPNNPTGTMIETAAVEAFLVKVPRHVVTVLDEAYFDFATHFATIRKIEYSKSLNFVRRGANVVVLRTFSKAHGLAGLRIGYGIGPEDLLTHCARAQGMYSVSSAAQAAAVAALDDDEHITKALTNNNCQADFLTRALSELGFDVTPTWANFLYCNVAQKAESISQHLLNDGISVRPLGAWGAPNCIRVSIGTPEQNRQFLQAMRKITLL